MHGPDGDRCWNPKVCHRRRSHYRKRDDINGTRRRLRRAGQSPSTAPPSAPIEILPSNPPLPPAAVLVLYRQHAHAPVHAVAAEVWQGNQKIAAVQAIHCLGMKGDRVTAYIKDVLSSLREQFGVTRFEDVIKEIPVTHCPIDPCPLKALPGTDRATHST